MAKVLFGEASPEERDDFEQLVREDESLQYQYEVLQQLLQNKPQQKSIALTAYDAADKAHNIIAKAEQLKKQTAKSMGSRKLWLVAAASATIIATGIFFFKNDKSIASPEKVAIVAEKGQRNKMVLPDGSKVWLNAGSSLFYVNDFSGATREVRLVGEGFFDIAENKAKPFIVHANDIDIKVLGTAFNVQAYEKDSKTVTTLYRGLVNVTRQNDSRFRSITLYPNQKLTVPKQSKQEENEQALHNQDLIDHSIVINQLDSAVQEPARTETAWMHGRLDFKATGFEELAIKLEEWYNVAIIFETDAVKKQVFTGSFTTENIEQALYALSTANTFKYRIENNRIYIR